MRNTSASPLGSLVSGPPARPPERILHTGRFVTLVPLTPSHTDDFYEVVGGEDNQWIWDYLPDGPFPDPQSLRNHIDRTSAISDPLFFAIIDNHTRKPVGVVSLKRIDIPNRVAELGHVTFSSLLQKKPGATETVYLLAGHIFQDLGYRHFQWQCDSLNAPFRRAAQWFGFDFEGVHRQERVMKGRSWDMAWFAMLDTKWPAHHRAYEEWLAPGNFDEEGRQITSLESFRQSVQAA